MRVGVVLRQGLETLAAMLFAWREARLSRRALTVISEGACVIIRQPRRAGEQAVARFPQGARVSADVKEAAQNGLVILELAAEDVVLRRISVPAQARDFLSGIVRNQIERLSPWQADQAVYGFNAPASVDDGATLDIPVFMTSRRVVDGRVEQIAAMGLRVDRIVARERDALADTPVTLWSRLANAPPVELARARRRIGAGIAAFVALSVGVSLWAIGSASAIREESEDLAARAKAIQRQLQPSHTPQSLAALQPEERAWVSKQTSAPAVITLEALSRALPDGAYLTELQLEKATLRITGLARDAPSLIAPLERSGHLVDVHFLAPTTRDSDGMAFRFSIEARVEPRLELAGH
ncbi:MAG: PilN domain-containing protein [Xanthobacteraceae bacterium]